MSKVMLGLLLGGILGIADGLTAWFTPAVRPMLLSIVMGSTFKGLITGIAAGVIARRTDSLTWAVVGGLAVGLTLSFIVAQMSPAEDGGHYYWEIMLPGSMVGLIAGYASQRFGRMTAQRA